MLQSMHVDSPRTVATTPRLQTLQTLKMLWSEYSALIVQSKIQLPASTEFGERTNQVIEPNSSKARVLDIKARWKTEARAIQFDFEFKAVEQERRRVAKELHDEVLPSLARLARSLQTQGASAANLVEAILRANSTFRDLLGELHPVDLEELGLVAALDNACSRYARLTNRVILFFEKTDEANFSELQQLALYRAVQCILKMFAESQNDILTVSCARENKCTAITIRCADKLVSSTNWISPMNAEYSAFEAWVGLGGAEVSFNHSDSQDQFPSDVKLTVADEIAQSVQILQNESTDELSAIRLKELDEILMLAKSEWSRLINRDRELFENLAIESERKTIAAQLDRLIVPRLKEILQFTSELANVEVQQQVTQGMRTVVSSVAAVMSELHPRLLAETSLLDSMRKLVARFKRASLIDTIVSSNFHDESVALSQDAKFAIYRVTQEALNNIEKHSGATRARVSVELVNENIVVCIEDNGKGIHGKANSLSRGLKNMQERATAIGASVHWRSAENFSTGTLLSITLALPEYLPD